MRAYGRIGRRFLDALKVAGVDLRRATLDDVQTALETIRVKLDGTPAKAATVNANVAIVKALLGFAHQVGYTRFNAAPLIKLRKAPRQLLPAAVAKSLLAMRGDASASDRVFPITERRINYIVKAIVKRAGGNPETSPHWLRHAHASHAIDNGAPITLVSQTLGHADLKTTSVYAHARPNESSSRFLKSQ